MKQKAYMHLLRYAQDHGAEIFVDDGDGIFVHYDTVAEAAGAIESVDVANVHFETENGKKRLGTALVSNDHSFEPEETVIDFTVTDFMNRWEKVYYDGQEGVKEPDPKQELLESLEKFSYCGLKVPGHIHQGIVGYIVDRRGVGDFLTAVISNDLSKAVSHADSSNLRSLAAITAWFYNHAPSDSWGSFEKYRAWLEGDRGSQHEDEAVELEKDA